MSIVYMPSKRCPTCPFDALCREEKVCPILEQSPVNIVDMKEELRQFAKLRNLKSALCVESPISPSEAIGD